MKRNSKRLARALTLLLCLWGTAQAKAQTYYNYTVDNNTANLVSGFAVSVDNNSESGILVGGIELTANGQAVPGYSDFTTVCTDLAGRIYLGSSYNFTVQSFSGQAGLNPAWGNNGSGQVDANAAYQAINNAAYLFSAYQSSATSPGNWAALQLAVWKALYDTQENGTIDWTSPRFTVSTDPSGTDWSLAQTWLNGIPANRPSFAGYLLYPTDSSVQEVLINVSPVPEPTTLAAGAILLVPFAASSSRFLARRSVA